MVIKKLSVRDLTLWKFVRKFLYDLMSPHFKLTSSSELGTYGIALASGFVGMVLICPFLLTGKSHINHIGMYAFIKDTNCMNACFRCCPSCDLYFNLILYLFQEDCRQPEATSGSPQHTYNTNHSYIVLAPIFYGYKCQNVSVQ